MHWTIKSVSCFKIFSVFSEEGVWSTLSGSLAGSPPPSSSSSAPQLLISPLLSISCLPLALHLFSSLSPPSLLLFLSSPPLFLLLLSSPSLICLTRVLDQAWDAVSQCVPAMQGEDCMHGFGAPIFTCSISCTHMNAYSSPAVEMVSNQMVSSACSELFSSL